MKKTWFIALVASLALVSCQNLLQKSEGQLALKVESAESKGVHVARTLIPDGSTIVSYSATGTGPGGATIAATTSTTGSFSFSGLLVGSWTITVSGLDSSGTVIATGSATVSITNGGTSSATVALTPPAGTGSLSLTVSWPSGQTVDAVSGSLTPSGGSATAISLTVAGNQATYSSSLATGSYLLILNIKNAGASVTSPRMDGVLIYNSKTTTGSYALSAADFVYKAVTGISLDKTSLGLVTGASAGLVPTFTPADATTQTLLWTSDKTSVATVDSSGKVTAVALGSATITATTVDGSKTASCAVTVGAALSGLNKTSTGLLVGGSEQLAPAYSSSDGSGTPLTWTSSNSSVASVNSSGLITGVSAGFATITATDGSNSKSCVVIVSASKVAVEGVTMSPTATTLFSGQSIQMSALPSPTDATDQSISWTSSSPTVASVSGSGLVSAVSAGSTSITATTNDGAKTATSTVYVSAAKWIKLDARVSSSTNTSFTSACTDSSGNIYAIGRSNSGSDYGNGISAQWDGPALIKYNSDGLAQWFFPSGYTWGCWFSSIVIDSSGNAIISGYVDSLSSTFDFGNGVKFTNPNNTQMPFIMKVDGTGKALWGQYLIGSGYAAITSISVDASDNIAIAGYISGTGLYSFNGGMGMMGTSTNSNLFVAQIGSDGTAKWARSVTSGTAYSNYNAVAVDASGNIFATGNASGALSLGSGISVAPTSYSFLLTKYSSSGTVLWAQTASMNSSGSSLACDAYGNAYVLGYANYGSISFGNVSFTGSQFIVKYDSSGTAQWANGITTSNASAFQRIALDGSGNILAVGSTPSMMSSTTSYDLGGITVNVGTNSSVIFAKYSSTGTPTNAEVLTSSTDSYGASGIAASSSGAVYVAGTKNSKAMLLKY
jgi:Bacterial surface proteins containing Ig-like domains